MTICTHLKELLKYEAQDLESEIQKNKWYLSEKAKHDVGWEYAERDFREKYLTIWASGYRKAFCHLVCNETKCEYKINK